MTETCPECFGDGCPGCDGKGSIKHGPWHPCQFCRRPSCGCVRCQGWCGCSGYFEYYVAPYMRENDGT